MHLHKGELPGKSLAEELELPNIVSCGSCDRRKFGFNFGPCLWSGFFGTKCFFLFFSFFPLQNVALITLLAFSLVQCLDWLMQQSSLFSFSECCPHHSPSILPVLLSIFRTGQCFQQLLSVGSFYTAAWAKPALGSAQLRSGAGCRCDLDQTGVTSLTRHCSERRQSVCCTFRLQLLCYRQQMTYSGMRAMLDSALKPG